MNEMYIIEKLNGGWFGTDKRIFARVTSPCPIFFSLDKSSDDGNGEYLPMSPHEKRDVFIFNGEDGGEMLVGGDLLIIHPTLFEHIPLFKRFVHLGKRDVRIEMGKKGSCTEKWDVVEILYDR